VRDSFKFNDVLRKPELYQLNSKCSFGMFWIYLIRILYISHESKLIITYFKSCDFENLLFRLCLQLISIHFPLFLLQEALKPLCRLPLRDIRKLLSIVGEHINREALEIEVNLITLWSKRKVCNRTKSSRKSHSCKPTLSRMQLWLISSIMK
jgi:hypothetical protein